MKAICPVLWADSAFVLVPVLAWELAGGALGA